MSSYKEKILASWKKSYHKPRQHLVKQRYHFADRGPYSQSYGFSCSHVWIQELDHKEGWALKNWCFPTVVLEKTLASPLGCKEIQPVYPQGNQPWIFIGRVDAEAETPVLWPPDAKSWLIGKDPAAGKDWRREENEEEMVGWHHRLRGHEFEQTLEIVENVGAWWTTVRGGCNRVGHDLMSKQQQQVHRTCEWVYNHSVFLTPFKKVTSGEDIGVWTHHWRVDFCRN